MILRYLGLGITALSIIGAWASLDRVVDIEFSDFHDQWLADGRPYGSRRTRQEVSFFKGGFARLACLNNWLASLPGWARSHAQADASLRSMRIWVVVSGLGFTLALLSAILGH